MGKPRSTEGSSANCHEHRLGWGIPLLAFVFLLLIFTRQPLLAQSQNIGGTVIDPSGAVVPDAAITIEDSVKGGVARQTTTNQQGQFQAISIEPGRYLIRIEKPGFKKAQLPITLD